MRIACDVLLTTAATEALKDAGAELLVIGSEISWEAVADTCDGLIYAGTSPLPENLYISGKRLRVVALLQHNENTVDREEATRAGLLLLEPERSEAASIADFALYVILRAARERKEGAVELANKTLGLIGFGPTAAEVARRARAFQMEVLAWDREISKGRAVLYDAQASDLVDLLVRSDFVVNLEALSDERRHRFGKDEIQLMKPEATLIHLADPALLHWPEVMRALSWGYLSHFVIDLPLGNQELEADLRPYLGDLVSVNKAGDTLEARQAIYFEMAADMVAALNDAPVNTAVNVPRLRALQRRRQRRWIDLVQHLGAMLGARTGRRPKAVDFVAGGIASEINRTELERYFFAAFAAALGEHDVNRVSGALWAKEGGIEVRWQSERTAEDHLSITVQAVRAPLTIAGTVRHERLYLTTLDAYQLTAEPTAHLLLVPHANRPGMVGQVGTLLGARHVNIGGMVLGQKKEARDTALMWIVLDGKPNKELLADIANLPGVLYPEYVGIPESFLTRRY